MWFVKAKRAQTSKDDETWVAGGVVPTLNGFDCGDTRTTVVILMREREGKAGGGKGFLLSDDKAFTLATSNFHTVFILDGTRVGDVRVYEDSVMQTVIQRWGTGGGNVPAIFPIDDAREVEKHQNGTGIGDDGAPAYTLDRLQAPAIAAVDFYNNSLSEKNQSLRSAASDASKYGGIMEGSTVRRLTPTECERLQGFPDGWTDGQADSHRYKQMGNAVAVPVVQWIIERMTK
jgi:DNA (cytosine-5)-methyltransferase 1